MGQWLSSNRTLRSAAQLCAQQEEYAQEKPKTSDRDMNTTNERDIPRVAVVIDSNRRMPQSGAAVRHDDTDKRRLDQVRGLERALNNRNMRIQEYQREQTELRHRLQQLEGKHEHSESRKAEAEDALQKMLQKAEVLQIQLQECKDDLFRLQPLNEISDSTILGQYNQMNQQTASWVDELFSRMDDENASRGASASIMHPFLKVEDAGVQDLLSSSPNAAEYWLRHAMNCFLQREVFVEGIYLSCLPESYTRFIRNTERNMMTLEPKRGRTYRLLSWHDESADSSTDRTTVDIWRSETLAALAHSPDMKRFRSAKALDLAEQLKKAIVAVMPEDFAPDANLGSIHEKIVVPAMELALNIQLTLGRYYFYPCTASITTAERRLTLQDSSKNVMIDITTRRILNDNSLVIVADDGTIGEKLFVLEPSMIRRGRGRKAHVLMRKAVYLVKLDKPLGKRFKRPMSGSKDVIMLE